MKRITRRGFIRYAALGVAVFVGGGVAGRYVAPLKMTTYGTRHRLAITEALAQMVDRRPVYHWAFEDLDSLEHLPQMPGPLIQAIEGDEVNFSVTNTLREAHGFRIPGVPGEVGAGIVIGPGETRTFEFAAPVGGSYMYLDHLNAPVNRVLGLHGPMIVLPKSGNTPYSEPTPTVQSLFDDLGTTDFFPGEPWRPERTRVWLFSSIDPRFNSMAERGESIDASRFREEFLPRYFTINGESGAYAAHNHHTVPSGRIGQPHLLRLMNAGMTADSPHIHGNHVYLVAWTDLAGNYRVEDNVRFVDTFTTDPGGRMDWLLPFRRPPDIPGDPNIPLRQLVRTELSLTLGGVGQSPLTYPMHGHNEISQSAAGGNYPQGMVTGWQITGDLDGVDFPPSNPKEQGGVNEETHGGH
ncbi:MAG: multicopper oxidase domain-containing protein [Chloroflexi bacterium]|nr:multicopper oxidase domain-containing protein [Chloroflexota bacterium]